MFSFLVGVDDSDVLQFRVQLLPQQFFHQETFRP